MLDPALWKKYRRAIAVTVVLLLALYWPLAFLLTHMPMDDVDEWDLPLDKIFHFGSFGLISFLLTGALGLWRGWHWKWVPTAIVIAAVYGVIDELTQIPFGRQADVRDWIADVSGATLGAILAGAICEVLHRRRIRVDADKAV